MAELDAAVYARQSHGKERSIEEQIEIGHERAAGEGWPVAEVYRDKTSASRFARTVREDWPRLLADLEGRRFGVLWIWESSRGDRDAEQWMGLLRRCRTSRVLIYVETHERLYDMSRPRDWRTLADEGVDSHYESEKTSLRVQRDLRRNAAKGRPHGITLYGYERIYDSRTRELVEQRPHPGHAPVVAEVFALFAAGYPISHIYENLNARGVRAPKGGAWGRATVRQLLANPAYIGRRRAGSTQADRRYTQEFTAVWPPLVDEATFWRVQRRLADPARKVTRPGRQKWLLSYLACCAECAGPLSGAANGRWYKCAERSCTYISREALDLYATEWVIAYLEKHGKQALAEGASSDREALAAQAEADRLQAQLDSLAADLSLSERTLAIREAALLPKIAAARDRARRAALPPVLAGMLTEDGIRAAWHRAPLAARRELLKALVAVTVRRAARRGEPVWERAAIGKIRR
jgi:DNA invertase Pin-like site-specific DNA recombinase